MLEKIKCDKKTRSIALSDGMMRNLFRHLETYTWVSRVTDRQTDRQNGL